MSGVSVRVELDDAALRAALARLAERVSDLEPVFAALGQVVVTRADLSFRDQASPWGEAWRGLSAVTLGRRRQGPGAGPAAAILRDSGRLAGSIHARPSAAEVWVGTDETVYAATHQFGRPDNRMFGRARAPIPARPFLPRRGDAVVLPAEDRDAMLDILRRALAAALP
jgi:phage virion morphogenesis protein